MIERKETTIAVSWEDKKEARKYASPTRDMKTGTKYETDSQIFHKILEFYKKHNSPLHDEPKRTYPIKRTDDVVVLETISS